MDFIFTDPETVKISALREGDFVVEIPTQEGIRGVRVNSGLRAMASSYEPGYTGTVYERRMGRRGRYHVDTRRLTFLTGKAVVYYPADFDVVVRRLAAAPALAAVAGS